MMEITSKLDRRYDRSLSRLPRAWRGWLWGLAMLAASSADAWAAAPSTQSLHRDGPSGFGNLPYGSSADDAVQLNRYNGRLVPNGKSAVMTYSVEILGLTFQVTQNYDSGRKATDAVATTSSVETTTACAARFNFILNALQANYGNPTAGPLASHDATGTADTYTVLFEFSKQDGIEAVATTPSGGANPAAAAGSAATPPPRGPCDIRLHYLPPGWVGKL
ncbi:MAG: hypothetical protein P4L71_01960 [Acetobacteraceae bacterium]|nr:hypothetical protein [Acetobacteraceae bacterium]